MGRPLNEAVLGWLESTHDTQTTVRLRPLESRHTRGALAGDDAPAFYVSRREEEHRPEQIRQRLRVDQLETMPRRRPSGDRPRYDGFVARSRRGSSR
jgi:hypothetical protein